MNQLLNQRQAAHLLRLSVRTLERHRTSGTGPRFVRLGRLIRYQEADLADWVRGGLRFSTSDNSAIQLISKGSSS
jgi:predicted DNA-binding transcriptional regulator AlpA